MVSWIKFSFLSRFINHFSDLLNNGKYCIMALLLTSGCSGMLGTNQESGDNSEDGSDIAGVELIASTAAQDQKTTTKGSTTDAVALDVRKYKLSNGLEVILIRNERLPLFSLHLFYQVGSKHEPKGMTGSSHFLEHMMFKGAKKFGQGAFDKIIEGNGGISNAYTTYDMTVYYETMPKEALSLILEVEADRMENLTLDEQGFISEKEVVLEERKMRYENSPKGQLYIRTFTQMFAGTPYETPVIGTIDDIKSVTRKQVYDYFKTYYAPNNATLVIAGDLHFGNVIKQVSQFFGPIPRSELLDDIKKERENEKLFKYRGPHQSVEHIYGKSENPLFMLAFPSYPYGHRLSYVGDLLTSMLAGQNSAYLTQKYVRSPRPLLSSIYAGNYNLQHTGLIYIYGEMLTNQHLKSFHEKLMVDLKNFCSNEVTDSNLLKVRNKILKSFYSELNTNKGIADYLGSLDVLTGSFENYRKEIDVYNSITVQELKEACIDLLVKPKPYYLTIWNKNILKVEI